MAVYGRMLSAVGGGLTNTAQFAEKNDAANIIIGLGGMGADAVSKIKGGVFGKIKPDDPDSVVPEYGSIKFLVVDRDRTGISMHQNGLPNDIDTDNEFFDISKSVKEILDGENGVKFTERRDVSWFIYDKAYATINSPTGNLNGIRQIGRLMFVENAETFYAKIKFLITSALSQVEKNEVNVHILTGLSGATGSGIFLDVCYLVRIALRELGIINATINGYFFMPDVVLSAPAIQSDSNLSRHIMINGYAALKELDYCMNFSNNGDRFHMDYSFTSINENSAPVDMAFLVSAEDQEGNIKPNGYQYAMRTVSDYIVDELTSAVGYSYSGHKSVRTISYSIIGGQMMRHGAGMCYNVLGYSEAAVPYSDIITYLGSRLFNAFKLNDDKSPSKGDVSSFLEHKVKADCSHLATELSGERYFSFKIETPYDLKIYLEKGSSPFLEAYDEALRKKMDRASEIASTIIDSAVDYDIESKNASLINRTFRALYNSFALNPEYGPAYASRLLSGNNNYNLINAVEDMVCRCRMDIEMQERHISLAEKKLIDAEEGIKSSILARQQKFEEFVSALCDYYSQIFKKEVYRILEDVLCKYKELLILLDKQFFGILSNVYESVIQTFKYNVSYFESTEKENYLSNVLSFEDIKRILDSILEKTDVLASFKTFMQGMLNCYDSWIDDDSNKISVFLNEFVNAQFPQVSEMSLENYLVFQLGTRTPEETATAIRTDILERNLYQNAEPLWYTRVSLGIQTKDFSMITVPENSATALSAAKTFAYEKGIHLYTSNPGNRISLVKIITAIPLYAFASISRYERVYEYDGSYGRHIFEAGDIDWNQLPSPIPASCTLIEAPERIKARNEELQALFDRAVKLGIITKEEDYVTRWSIRKTADIDIDGLRIELYTTKVHSEVSAFIGKLETLIAESRTAVESIKLESGRQLTVENDRLVTDFFKLSPVNNKIVRSEVSKADDLQKLLAQAKLMKKSFIGGGDEVLLLQSEFRLAVFTGVISCGEQAITCMYEEEGTEQVIELQNASMPYFRSGLYQAFLSYMELDPFIRTKIRVAAQKLAGFETDEDVKCVSRVVNELLAELPGLIPLYVSFAEVNYKDKYPAINNFYIDFMDDLRKFKVLNRI